MGIGDRIVVLQRTGKPGNTGATITPNAAVGDKVFIRQVAGKSPVVLPSNGGVGDRVAVAHSGGKQRVVLGGCPGILGSAAKYYNYGNPPTWHPSTPPVDAINFFRFYSGYLGWFYPNTSVWHIEGCTIHGEALVGLPGCVGHYIWALAGEETNVESVSLDWKATASDPTGYAEFLFYYYSGSNLLDGTSGPLTPDGAWHHLDYNYNSTYGWYMLFVLGPEMPHSAPYDDYGDFWFKNLTITYT